MAGVTSFDEAAEKHLDDVYGYLVWFTGDRFAAEDLTGETFERALQALAPLRPRARLRAHVALPGRPTIALDHFRSEKRRQRREQLAASPERFEDRARRGSLARARGRAPHG